MKGLLKNRELKNGWILKTTLALQATTLLAGHAAWSQAAPQPNEPTAETRLVAVHSTKSRLDVELNEKSVLCSKADYSMPMLKVLIPGLGDITLLNHQNRGAGAPCVTTGKTCGFTDGAKPDDILQGRPGTESIEVTVTETRIESIDHVAKTCTVRLLEEVETEIRGQKLSHRRQAELSQRSYLDCVTAAKGGQK